MVPNAKERKCGGQSQKFVEYVWPLRGTDSRAEFQTRIFLRFGDSNIFPAPSLSR